MSFNYKQIICLLFIVLAAPMLWAHQFNPYRLNIIEQLENQYIVSWWEPSTALGDLALKFPTTCAYELDNTNPQGVYQITEGTVSCQHSLKGTELIFEGDALITEILVSVTYLDLAVFETIVDSNTNKLQLPVDNTNTNANYFGLGLKHFLSGYDHILFIIGIFFLVVGWGNLLKTITAFTIAHSLTLALAVLDVVRLPQTSIEIIIALTIVYLALEIANKKQYQRTPWRIAFGFGLLHGMGFANLLINIGIEGENLLYSLLLFNIGIEVGQILVLPCIALGIWLLARTSANHAKVSTNTLSVASYVLGITGCYWVIDRSVDLFI